MTKCDYTAREYGVCTLLDNSRVMMIWCCALHTQRVGNLTDVPRLSRVLHHIAASVERTRRGYTDGSKSMKRDMRQQKMAGVTRRWQTRTAGNKEDKDSSLSAFLVLTQTRERTHRTRENTGEEEIEDEDRKPKPETDRIQKKETIGSSMRRTLGAQRKRARSREGRAEGKEGNSITEAKLA